MKIRPHAEWRWRVADGVAILGLLFFVFYHLTAFRFDTLFTTLSREVDFKQWYRFPPMVLQHLQYPSLVTGEWTIPFPYLPSAIAMFLPLSALPEPVAFGLWIFLQASSLAAVLWAALKLTNGWDLRGRLFIALAAVLMTSNPLSWDFRTHNNNVIYLALVMLALMTTRQWLSGLLLGISFNMKIYSGPLVAVFLWRREYRLAIAMIAASILIAVALPVLVFGPSGYVGLLGGWVQQALHFNPPPGVPAVLPPDLFRLSASTLLGVESEATPLLLYTAQALWALTVVGYFAVATWRAPALADGCARLADVCVLLLAPLPFSPWFQPYHAVVLLPAYVLLLTVAATETEPRGIRVAAGMALLGSQILYYSFRSWEFRGAVFLAIFLTVTITLGAVRRHYVSNPWRA